MVRFDLSDWEWANMLVGRNYRPDRLPNPVIDAECLLLGVKQKSISGDRMSVHSQNRKSRHPVYTSVETPTASQRF